MLLEAGILADGSKTFYLLKANFGLLLANILLKNSCRKVVRKHSKTGFKVATVIHNGFVLAWG